MKWVLFLCVVLLAVQQGSSCSKRKCGNEGSGSKNGAAKVHVKGQKLDEKRTLQNLKAKPSAVPDGIPPYIFKDCRSVLAKPLLHIYNKCLHLRWKITRVVPVPKGKAGDEEPEAGNAKPVLWKKPGVPPDLKAGADLEDLLKEPIGPAEDPALPRTYIQEAEQGPEGEDNRDKEVVTIVPPIPQEEKR